MEKVTTNTHQLTISYIIYRITSMLVAQIFLIDKSRYLTSKNNVKTQKVFESRTENKDLGFNKICSNPSQNPLCSLEYLAIHESSPTKQKNNRSTLKPNSKK